MTNPVTLPVDQLPDTVRDYLDARAAGDLDRALAAFGPDAEVLDEGRTYRGAEGIRTFLTKAGAQFTFTTELVGAERVDDALWVAHHRLEGDFPGGVAELAFRFQMAGGLIARLHVTA